eukprot:7211484-Lingulodinium_polyedra.AAC.1
MTSRASGTSGGAGSAASRPRSASRTARWRAPRGRSTPASTWSATAGALALGSWPSLGTRGAARAT